MAAACALSGPASEEEVEVLLRPEYKPRSSCFRLPTVFAAVCILLAGVALWPHTRPLTGHTDLRLQPGEVAEILLSENHTATWDYKGFQQGDWQHIGYPLCEGLPTDGFKHNEFQSPVNLPNYRQVKKGQIPRSNLTLTPVVLDGGCPKYLQESNGHTWETSFHFTDCKNLKAEWKGKTYILQQFHFHSESENMMDFSHFDGELHMVHQSDDGAYLVIGFFLDMKSEDVTSRKFLKQMFSEGYSNPGVTAESEPIDPYAALINSGDEFYSYSGSFTTPPCTPDVEWISFIKPVGVKKRNFKDFRKFLRNPEQSGQQNSYGMDFRPIQAWGDRPCVVGTA